MESWVTSSASSTRSPYPSKSMAYPRSDVRVNLKDHYSSKVYTSSSPISGDVTITTKRDVPFDQIQILLLGQTKTSFEGVSVPQEVTHTFLKMMMPIPDSTYPTPRVLESGQTYTIPFNFVVPNQLTINACNHERLSDQMQDHHVLLPPSLGGWERDDMAPKMARVEYSVKARVLREDGKTKTRIMEASQAIQVLPTSVEEPPLNVTDKDKLYRMSKTKTLRKGLLSSKLGRLTADAVQPSAAILSPDGRRVMSHPLAHIKLTFDPENTRTLPPTITAVTAKLTAHTYFSSGTISTFPNLGEWNTPYIHDRRGQFFTSTPLPPITLAEQPAWTPTTTPPISRRDSGYSSSSPPSSPTLAKSQLLHVSENSHTTTLTVPLSLPTDKKTLVPTFHSCIASRVYTVALTLSLSARGGATSSVTLSVPLQIAIGSSSSSASQGSGADGAVVVQAPLPLGLPSFEEAVVDEHFRPRVLGVAPEYETQEGRGEWMFRGGAELQAGPEGLPEYGESGYRRVA